jgi:hypothetical protein
LLSDFSSLLPFITAGLRSFARVSSEATSPSRDTSLSVSASWEGLADRLEWEDPSF